MRLHAGKWNTITQRRRRRGPATASRHRLCRRDHDVGTKRLMHIIVGVHMMRRLTLGLRYSHTMYVLLNSRRRRNTACLIPFPPLPQDAGRREGDVGTPARPSRSAQRNNARTLKGAGRRQAPRPRSASSMADRYMTANFELTERRSGAIGYSVRAYLSGSIPRIKKGIPIVSAGLGGARRAYRQWYFLGIPMPSRPLSQGR